MASKKQHAAIDFQGAATIKIDGATTASRYLGTTSSGNLEWKPATTSSGPSGMAITRRATASASSGAITLSGFYSSAFPAYKIVGTGIYASTDQWSSGTGGDPQFLKVSLGTSSAWLNTSSYDDYKWHMIIQYPNFNDGVLFEDDGDAADGLILRGFRNHKFNTTTTPYWNRFWRIGNLYNDEYQTMNFEMNLYGLPALGEASFASSRASCHFTCKSVNRDAWFEAGSSGDGTVTGTPMFSEVTSSGMFSVDDSADIDISRMKFEAGSGTLSGGTISVYDISHTN
jgi:hypothetical protein